MHLWLKNRECVSPDIVNEIIVLMGQNVLRTILAQIKTSMWFALIADEASDISHNEHVYIYSVGE